MRLVILSDSHFGARNDSPLFLEHFMRFYDRVFFPYIETHAITDILHLGDFLDRRKYVNFSTLAAVQSGFVKRLEATGAQMHCILGNHDIFYKNTSTVNSLRECFSDKFTVYEKPTLKSFDGREIALLPWINKENEAESLEFVRTVPTDILCGHLELSGFNVLRNTPFEGGMNPDIFKRFSAVYSGHFHSRHSRDNIHYLGCPYQITMNDYGEKKGFHVLDTDTGDLEFIHNPYTIFTQIRYNDTDVDAAKPITAEEAQIKHKFVRIIVEAKTKPYLFERYVDSLYAHQPHSVTVIEDLSPDTTNADEQVDLSEDTITIINREIDGLQNVDGAKLKALLRDLYTETQALENTKQQ